MAAPIATLAVRISAQLAEFQKSFNDGIKTVDDFKSSFEKTAASIQGTIDGIANSFSKFGSVIGTVGVAVAGVTVAAVAFKSAFDLVKGAVEGVGDFVRGAVERTAELGDSLFALSQKTGLSVESLSGFKFVAAQTNTSLDSITNAVFKLESNLGSGAKKTADALSGIGLSLQQLKTEGPEQAFTDIIAKLGEIPNATDRAAAGVAIFGKSFRDIAQLSQENLPALIAQAKQLGVVMSTETAVASDRLNDALGAIRAAMDGLVQQIGAKLIPAAVAFAEVFGGIFIDAIASVTQSTGKLGEGFDAFVVQVGEAAGRFIEVLARMTEAVAEWAIATSKRIAEEINDFLNLAPSIIAVGKALDLALNQGSHASAFDSLSRTLENLRKPLDNIAQGAAAAGQTIRDFAKGIGDAAGVAGQNFGQTFTRIQQEISQSATSMRNSLNGVGDTADTSFKKAGKAAKDFTDEMESVGDSVSKIDRKLADFDLREMEREFAEMARNAKAGIDQVDSRLEKFADKWQQEDILANTPFGPTGFGAGLGLSGFTPSQISSLGLFGTKAAKAVTDPFRKAFAELASALPDAITRGFQQGGVVGAFAGVAEVASGTFGKVFSEGMERTLGDFSQLRTSEKMAGVGALAAKSFVQGFQSGLQNGGGANAAVSFGEGFLSGFLSTGNPYVGLVTGGIQLASTLLGASQKADEAARQLAISQGNLARQFGGQADFLKLAQKAGFQLKGNLVGSQRQLTTEQSVRFILNPDIRIGQFNTAVGQLNDALAEYDKKLKAIDSATQGLNTRAAVFAKNFSGLADQRTDLLGGRKPSDLSGSEADSLAAINKKIQETAQRTQPEFERLGILVKDTFSAMVKESGDAIGALNALAPSFQTLKSGVTDWGLESTKTIDNLLKGFDLLNNQDFAPFFANIQSTGQVFKGLFDAKALSPEGFQAAAEDIGQSIQEIINRGGDMAQTLALSQPILQALWEAQQTYGAITDQTTQSILAQAQQQGLVGENMKDVNQQILDVLLAIADVFGAKLPEGFRRAQTAAQQAATGIETALNGIDVPTINIPVNIELPDGADPRFRTLGVPALATGGIVTRRTLALVGESGPEAVVPLNRPGVLATSGGTAEIHVDRRVLARVLVPAIPGEVRRYGVS